MTTLTEHAKMSQINQKITIEKSTSNNKMKKHNYFIYNIVCNDLDVSHNYVGSTRCWKQRKFCHKQRTTNENGNCYNYPVYECIRKFGGWDNWSMVQLENIVCTRREAEAIERKWIETKKADLNSCKRPYITEEERKSDQKKFNAEYRKNFPEKSKAYAKQYREEHKEEIKLMKKEHYQKNKEHIKAKANQYYADNKEKVIENVKQYYEKNKVAKAEYNKEYRAKNKEALQAYREEHKEKYQEYNKNYNKEYKAKNKARLHKKFECECGGSYIYRNKAQHAKTKRHQAYLQSMINHIPN
jgi:hypothetical protein